MRKEMKKVIVIVTFAYCYINSTYCNVLDRENPLLNSTENEDTETEVLDTGYNFSSIRSANLIKQNDDKPWFTRCCDFSDFRNCSQFQENELINLKNMVYDGIELKAVPDGFFKIVNKKNCDGAFKLEKEYNEDWYLQANGKIYHPELPAQPDIIYTSPQDYCLDFRHDENNSLVVDAYLCLAGQVLEAVQNNRQPEVYLFGKCFIY